MKDRRWCKCVSKRLSGMAGEGVVAFQEEGMSKWNTLLVWAFVAFFLHTPYSPIQSHTVVLISHYSSSFLFSLFQQFHIYAKYCWAKEEKNVFYQTLLCDEYKAGRQQPLTPKESTRTKFKMCTLKTNTGLWSGTIFLSDNCLPAYLFVVSFALVGFFLSHAHALSVSLALFVH